MIKRRPVQDGQQKRKTGKGRQKQKIGQAGMCKYEEEGRAKLGNDNKEDDE